MISSPHSIAPTPRQSQSCLPLANLVLYKPKIEYCNGTEYSELTGINLVHRQKESLLKTTTRNSMYIITVDTTYRRFYCWGVAQYLGSRWFVCFGRDSSINQLSHERKMDDMTWPRIRPLVDGVTHCSIGTDTYNNSVTSLHLLPVRAPHQ